MPPWATDRTDRRGRPPRGSPRRSWRGAWASTRRGSSALAEAGAIDRAADGTFDPGDVHRVRLLQAFEESGVPLDALIDASAAGRISLRYYDELHQPPAALTGRTYEAFAASLGDRRGAPRPGCSRRSGSRSPTATWSSRPTTRPCSPSCLDALDTTGEPDLVLRAIRMFGEGLRRAADAALGIYGEAVARTGEDLAGLPVDEAFDRVLRPWARFARSSGRAVGLALAAAHEPGDRRVQHRRERADPPGVGLPRGPRRVAAGRGLRRPDRLHAADRRSWATRPRPRSRCAWATSRSR